MNTKNPSIVLAVWPRLLPLMTRLRIGRWLNDAGRNLGRWVAPEMAEIAEVLATNEHSIDEYLDGAKRLVEEGQE